MKKYSLLLLLLCWGLSEGLSQECTSNRYKAPVFDRVTKFEKVVYAKSIPYSRTGKRIYKEYTFDFYEPESDELTARPLVLMMAGGSFQDANQNKKDAKTWCDSLARYGYACATVEYRLGYDPSSRLSVERAIYRSVQDVRAAIRHFKEYSLMFKIDTSRIYIGGDEAGAIAALHTAYMTTEEKRPRSTFGINSEPTDLGCLDCSGNNYRYDVGVAGVINLRGVLTPALLENIKKKIPTVHVEEEEEETSYREKGDNPLAFLKMQGSEKLHRRMEDLNIDNELVISPVAFQSSAGMSVNTTMQIWNAVWSSINRFLYNTLEFTTPSPLGSTLACSGKAETYSLPQKEGSSYCWKIEGGRIVKNKGNEVAIIWNYNTKIGRITVTERNEMAVVGKPSVPLEVEIRTAPQAEFSINKIKEHIIIVTDESAYGAFYTLDFGDGSNPFSGKMGTTTNHTYPEMGTYTITQVLENSCGIAVSTQNVEVADVPLRIATPTMEENVVVYPNPAKPSDEIGINFLGEDGKTELNIQVAKEDGELLFIQTTKEANSSTAIIKPNTLKVGNYTIEIQIGEKVVKKTLTVE